MIPKLFCGNIFREIGQKVAFQKIKENGMEIYSKKRGKD